MDPPQQELKESVQPDGMFQQMLSLRRSSNDRQPLVVNLLLDGNVMALLQNLP
jgi:hypothetical protein